MTNLQVNQQFTYKLLRAQRLPIRKNKPKNLKRAYKITYRSNPVYVRKPILTDYANYLDQITDYSYKTTNSSNISYSPTFFEQFSESLSSDETKELKHFLQSNTNYHRASNQSDHYMVSKLISGVIARMSRAINEIDREMGKTGGAAIKRRIRSINTFKSAKSDFNLLLSSARDAIGSTMKLRRYLQDTTTADVIYYETKNGLKSYQSKQFTDDCNAIVNILNHDVNYTYLQYKTIKSAIPLINDLVTKYNYYITNNTENLVQAK